MIVYSGYKYIMIVYSGYKYINRQINLQQLKMSKINVNVYGGKVLTIPLTDVPGR